MVLKNKRLAGERPITFFLKYGGSIALRNPLVYQYPIYLRLEKTNTIFQLLRNLKNFVSGTFYLEVQLKHKYSKIIRKYYPCNDDVPDDTS